MKLLIVISTLALGGFVAAGAAQASLYQRDDGSAEVAEGFHDPSGSPTDFIALNQFNVLSGQNMIGAVEIAWGSPFSPDPTLNGLTYTAAIWSDPNSDGNPSDAVLLAQASGVITNASTDTFNVTLFNCVQVTQSFFVGFLITVNAAQNPVGFDVNGGFPPGSFLAASQGGTGDITNLMNNNILPVTSSGVLAIGGNFLIRADPCVVPEPGTTALLFCGALTGLVRVRGRLRKLRCKFFAAWPD